MDPIPGHPQSRNPSAKYEEMKNVIRSAKVRWLTDADITDILVNYSSYGFPISSSCAQRPIASGSLYLYNRAVGTDWQKDNYNWVDSGESVMRSPTAMHGTLHCITNEGIEISRRGYWLETQPNIILAHYLSNSPETIANRKSTPGFTSGLDDLMMDASLLGIDGFGDQSDAKCDMFLSTNPENFSSSGTSSSGMRRIKTSPGALSSLAGSDPRFGLSGGSERNPFPGMLKNASTMPTMPTMQSTAAKPNGPKSQRKNTKKAKTQKKSQPRPPSQPQPQPPRQQPPGYYMFGNAPNVPRSMQRANAGMVPTPTMHPSPAVAADRAVPAAGIQPNGMRRIMSSPMPLHRLGKQDASDPERTSKRKARKAEVARACRKRKKAYIQSLEQKAAILQRKLAEMTGKASQSKSVEEMHRNEQERILGDMSKAISAQYPDAKDLKKLVNLFVTNSRQQKDLYWRHIENCLKSVTPGAQAKFALWGLDQDDEFYEKPGLWKTLMSDEVGLDESQMKKLLRSREQVRESKAELLGLQHRLVLLKNDISEHLGKRYRLLDRLLETLKPIQIARFFLWVSKNSTCMQMLQTVWKVPFEEEETPGNSR
mmetsp:Transcript_11350/g.27929  ORF Transcript_11350/g.27929 Transcript_11350/m.27929 type:complete len:597 (-) Transcript_11350:335-2125(-)|eukprot:CAMPEP_0114516162 /NCGR_PEP_ID=MMETSP0109-20121206/17177_1 /TAXON_ID=29199 /ORGANISM="Chlorarachnion reptans, Strain CCCM449" /LENGTH=596 /DNA_ID=CAMNT_0001696525 /DNA_START=357 /DNA_END=2147 /DNA_ORIENTATION=+